MTDEWRYDLSRLIQLVWTVVRDDQIARGCYAIPIRTEYVPVVDEWGRPE